MDDTVHRATFVVVILFAVVLRVVFLSQPMRFDEALTFVHFASPPLPRGLYNYASPNNHIFHTLQVHIAYRVFGDDPWAIRLPACVAGVLIVPATYLLIRRLYNRDAALLASGCAASSSALIEFSTNARGYSLVTLTFLALLVVATFLKRRPFRGAWVLFAVLAALGFYTMPIMAYPFAIVVAWLVLSLIGSVSPGERRRVVRGLVFALGLTLILTAILYAPLILKVLGGWKAPLLTRLVAPKKWSVFVWRLPWSLRHVWRQWNRDIPTVIRVVLVVGLFASLVLHGRLTRYRVPLVLPVLLSCGVLLTMQRVVPRVRFWLFLLPVYFGLVSSGFVGLLNVVGAKVPRYRSLLCSILALAVSAWLSVDVLRNNSVYYSKETGWFTDGKAVTLFLKANLRRGDKVLAKDPATAPLQYYFHVNGLPLRYLKSKGDMNRRVLVLLHKSYGQTMERVLAKNRAVDKDLGVPEIIREYECATLYEMNNLGKPFEEYWEQPFGTGGAADRRN